MDPYDWRSIRPGLVVSQLCGILPPANVVGAADVVAIISFRTVRYDSLLQLMLGNANEPWQCRLGELWRMADGMSSRSQGW